MVKFINKMNSLIFLNAFSLLKVRATGLYYKLNNLSVLQVAEYSFKMQSMISVQPRLFSCRHWVFSSWTGWVLLN